jgi:hypothetical protein
MKAEHAQPPVVVSLMAPTITRSLIAPSGDPHRWFGTAHAMRGGGKTVMRLAAMLAAEVPPYAVEEFVRDVLDARESAANHDGSPK